MNPVCPICGETGMIIISTNEHEIMVICNDKQPHKPFIIEEVSDFAQFFPYPQWRDVKVELPEDETGWLLEREANGQIEYIGVIDGILNWTPDSLKALRLCRREDADALCEIVEDCWKVADHRWVQPLPAPPEGQSKEQG